MEGDDIDSSEVPNEYANIAKFLTGINANRKSPTSPKNVRKRYEDGGSPYGINLGNNSLITNKSRKPARESSLPELPVMKRKLDTKSAEQTNDSSLPMTEHL